MGAGHRGKEAEEFVASVTVHEALKLPRNCASIRVQWSRGSSHKGALADAPVYGEACVWSDASFSFPCTLYRDADSHKYDPKWLELKLLAAVPGPAKAAKSHAIGLVKLDLARATDDDALLRRRFVISPKHAPGAELVVSVSLAATATATAAAAVGRAPAASALAPAVAPVRRTRSLRPCEPGDQFFGESGYSEASQPLSSADDAAAGDVPASLARRCAPSTVARSKAPAISSSPPLSDSTSEHSSAAAVPPPLPPRKARIVRPPPNSAAASASRLSEGVSRNEGASRKVRSSAHVPAVVPAASAAAATSASTVSAATATATAAAATATATSADRTLDARALADMRFAFAVCVSPDQAPLQAGLPVGAFVLLAVLRHWRLLLEPATLAGSAAAAAHTAASPVRETALRELGHSLLDAARLASGDARALAHLTALCAVLQCLLDDELLALHADLSLTLPRWATALQDAVDAAFYASFAGLVRLAHERIEALAVAAVLEAPSPFEATPDSAPKSRSRAREQTSMRDLTAVLDSLLVHTADWAPATLASTRLALLCAALRHVAFVLCEAVLRGPRTRATCGAALRIKFALSQLDDWLRGARLDASAARTALVRLQDTANVLMLSGKRALLAADVRSDVCPSLTLAELALLLRRFQPDTFEEAAVEPAVWATLEREAAAESGAAAAAGPSVDMVDVPDAPVAAVAPHEALSAPPAFADRSSFAFLFARGVLR